MASSRATKLRIASSVIFATGFFDAIAGRFVFQAGAQTTPPPPPDPNAPQWQDMGGALHVHSTYSDGAGDIPTVMEGACQAGVDWLLLADHNTQRPLRDGWESRFEEKPLLLIGTEVTVEHGAFLLALDMPPEWEPKRDLRPQEVIDDVNARGGLPLVSLPFDIKHPWREWDATGYQGLEVINFSTVARRHINLLSLAWLLPIYKMQGMLPTLRALLARPDQAFARWDTLLATPGMGPQIGIGALDAHALMKIGKKKYPIPSYADSFTAVLTHVLIPQNAPDPRRAIYEALRAGRCYFSYDLLGDPRAISFRGQHGAASAEMGGEITTGATLEARAEKGTLLRLYRHGKIVAAGRNGFLSYTATEPGAYRIEAYRSGLRLGPLYLNARPWIFTNPIYVK
jgi:hypothetical protein